jgi:hypothetical protein
VSLVHEALERAREEAARREALARGESTTPRPAPPQYRFVPSRWLAAAAAALVIGLAGFALAILVRRPPGPAPTGGTLDSSPVPASPSPSPAAPPVAATTAIGEPTPSPPASSAAPTAGVASGQAPTAPAAPPRADRRPAARPAAALGREVVALELQGIVWSSERPTAVINGIVLGLGETVAGFTLLRVEPRGVVLGDGEREIELRLEAAPAAPPADPS